MTPSAGASAVSAAMAPMAMQAADGLAVVVPVLDEAPTLAERLQALAALRAGGARVVVVDGGSTDASRVVAANHADEVRSAPRGRASQMNAGAAAALATGARVLLFLHADTVLPADAWQHIARALQRGAVWGRFDVTIDAAGTAFRIIEAAMNLRSRLAGIATGDQAMFVTADAFEAAGGFPDIALMEDIALSRRLKRIARPACLRARVHTSARRWQTRGIWRTVWLMWRLRAAYFFGADPARLAIRYGYRPRR